MKPFKKIAIAALAASVAGTALTAGLSASAQNATANQDGGQRIQQNDGPRLAFMDGRGGQGQGFGRGHGMRGGKQRAERLFERFDVNEDGAITKAEIEKIRTQEFASADADSNGEISLEEFKAAFLTRSNDRMVRAFQFMDRDGDGTVTQEEADLLANRMFNMLDRDGNGSVERVRGPRGPMADDDDRGPRRPMAGDDDRGPRLPMADDDDRGPRRERAERSERGERGGRGDNGWRGGPQMGRGGHGGGGAMFLGMFDTDADGKVSREEFDTRRAALFALADTDQSGSFTLQDFGPLWLAINENRVVDMFQRADADGSLGITAEEQKKHQDRMLERADRNNDGVITKADFRGGRKGGHGPDHGMRGHGWKNGRGQGEGRGSGEGHGQGWGQERR
ncbi:EF-hand domain-containing protein [Roseibium sp. FZY0029]|uniref:EF-hand domain-containing protein n=1 Tax=Roseibium sp. FZY0029 TaxID=3116647 RepID=UPI002EB82D14|nr:EF-hand domain-containing protein [Roseibium sp. FZY0029]